MSTKIIRFGSILGCATLLNGGIALADIGFEFESNKNTRTYQSQNGLAFTQAQLKQNCDSNWIAANTAKADYKQPLIEGDGFTAEADATRGGSDLEIVVHSGTKKGFSLDDDGQKELISVLSEVDTIYRAMNTYTKLGQYCILANTLSQRSGANNKFIQITTPQFATTKVVVQATLGIRLDRLARFMQQIDEPGSESQNFFLPAENNSGGSFGSYQIKAAADAADDAVNKFSRSMPNAAFVRTFNTTGELRGLVAITTLYLWATKNQAGDLVKNISPIMARTDFAKLFSLLPNEQRNYFANNRTAWISLALTAAGMPNDGQQPLFEKHNFLKTQLMPQNNQILTKERWLDTMVGRLQLGYKPGKDLLTARDNRMLDGLGQPWFDTLGGLGNKTDRVRGVPTVREAPIFELRALRGVTPGKLKGFALDLFDYARAINSNNAADFSPKNYNNATW